MSKKTDDNRSDYMKVVSSKKARELLKKRLNKLIALKDAVK